MAKGLTERWAAKGGSHVKPAKTGSVRPAVKKRAAQAAQEDSVPFPLQQMCLDIFRDALKPGNSDNEILQKIKGHLYNRDFATAFGKEEYLRVYASRWSPSRGLGYLQILHDIREHIMPCGSEDSHGDAMTIVGLGGGAGAELVAIAGWLSILREKDEHCQITARLLDISDWHVVVGELHRCSELPSELSKYASAAAKEANKALLPEDALKVNFTQQDVLDWPEDQVSEYCTDADLITLMFTLNELYSTSIQKTQRFLAHLTVAAKPNSLLLIVDSPGSYSTVSINAVEKKYPMHWLLDHTLLATVQEVGKVEVGAKWEKVMSNESKWFRLPQGLRYPIELENMRYQIHLYRRTPGVAEPGGATG